MTTKNNKITHTIGEINRTILFFKNNNKKKYGLDCLKEELRLSENKLRNILRFLTLNKIILKVHNSNGKRYYYNNVPDIQKLIDSKILSERRNNLGMMLLILNELEQCNLSELADSIKESKKSLLEDVEKLKQK